MIVSYANKETEQFSQGLRIRSLENIERAGRLKLNKLKSATVLADIAKLPGNRFKSSKGIVQGNTVSVLMISGAFVFVGKTRHKALLT